MMKLRSLHTTKIFDFNVPEYLTKLKIPFVDVGISTGFPSPANDFIENSIDLNKHLIKHKDSTFFTKVKGYSMKDASVFVGDLLVIDNSLVPQDAKISICQIDGVFTVKRIKKKDNIVWFRFLNNIK